MGAVIVVLVLVFVIATLFLVNRAANRATRPGRLSPGPDRPDPAPHDGIGSGESR